MPKCVHAAFLDLKPRRFLRLLVVSVVMTTLLDLSVFIIKRKHGQLYDSAKYCL